MTSDASRDARFYPSLKTRRAFFFSRFPMHSFWHVFDVTLLTRSAVYAAAVLGLTVKGGGSGFRWGEIRIQNSPIGLHKQ